jgi:hypothetical protein
MSTKKVAISGKPRQGSDGQADAWVRNRNGVQPTKRLTIDLPASLHARVKAGCALRGIPIKDVVREFLEREFSG